jgi:hypothetical protein
MWVGSGADRLALARGYRMVQIKRDSSSKDFTCPHCGAVYEISESPAHDTGSVACEVCDRIMMNWADSAIPMFRAKKSIKESTRRDLFLDRAAGG